jgi:hypothetical protein
MNRTCASGLEYRRSTLELSPIEIDRCAVTPKNHQAYTLTPFVFRIARSIDSNDEQLPPWKGGQ